MRTLHSWSQSVKSEEHEVVGLNEGGGDEGDGGHGSAHTDEDNHEDNDEDIDTGDDEDSEATTQPSARDTQTRPNFPNCYIRSE
ncbi:hypothetical protein ACOMHN_042601 [Nucella lapillus]